MRDHCHITGEYRGAAHAQSNFNVKESNLLFIPKASDSTTNYDSHLSFNEMKNRKDSDIPFNVIPQIDEKFITNTFGRLRNNDGRFFTKMCLAKKFEAMGLYDFIQSKKVFGDNWEIFTGKLANSYDFPEKKTILNH